MSEVLFQDIQEKTGLYYYMTMMDFEREDIRKNKRKSRKLNSEEKQELHKLLRSNIETIFSFSILEQSIIAKSLQINNYEDLFQFFSSVDLFRLIPPAELLDTYFPCILIEGNHAWISKNHQGHFRYFTKTKNELTIGLDLIDLLEIYYGCTTSKAIERAVRDFNITFMEDVWMEKENKKYLSNFMLIHGAKERIEVDYPVLYEYLKNHLKVLETLNVIANIHIKKQEFSHNGHNIFFASNSYIADFLTNYTLSTTNKVINLFAVLGIIQKIKIEDIPPELLHQSKIIADNRSLGNIISYYVILPLEDVLEEGERRAKILSENEIFYSNISRQRILYAFGEEFTSHIYVQEIQKNKKKQMKTSSTISDLLEKNLLELLQKNEYATKKMVAKKYIQNTVLKDREQELDKLWKAMINRHQLKYFKPSQVQKERYNLKSNDYIITF